MAILLNEQDLERPRRPSELARFVETQFEAIQKDDEAKKAARLRNDLFKYLICEIYPLSMFVIWRYPSDDVLCAPKIGNQGHDAGITDLAGKPLEKIEITWPVDGQAAHFEARSLNERGFTDAVTRDANAGRAESIERILAAATKKARNDYGDASLLIVFDLWPAFFLSQSDARADIASLIERLRALPFKARGVFLVLMPTANLVSPDHAPVIQVK